MEKLIELLETFEKERVEKLKSDVWKNDTISPRIWSKSDVTIYNKLQVISKEFGFIKRLVDNDKIDLDKVKEIGIKHNGKMDVDGLYRYSVYERVLMLLSISSLPIDDLISILK